MQVPNTPHRSYQVVQSRPLNNEGLNATGKRAIAGHVAGLGQDCFHLPLGDCSE